MSVHRSQESTIPDVSGPESDARARSVIESLSHILHPLPPSLSSSETPALTLLHDSDVAAKIASHLRQADSGAVGNNLCRWLYDTFQSSDPNLQLVVLRFLPIIAGIYLSRAVLGTPLAGFEAILLALYAHETTFRGGQPLTVNVPDLSHSSIYHETRVATKNNSTDINLAIVSPSLEPHGTVRSTKRARIVGVALELYYTRISQMPTSSKLEFCEFCVTWAGQDGKMYEEDEDENENEEINEGNEIVKEENVKGNSSTSTGEKDVKENKDENENEGKEMVNKEENGEETKGDSSASTGEEHVKENKDENENEGNEIVKKEENGEERKGNSSSSTGEDVKEENQCNPKKEGRIPLPWELLQPVLRILGHCVMGPMDSKELKEVARAASRSLYARALHDVNPQAILATRSLLRIGKMSMIDSSSDFDHTEISDFKNPVITI